MNIKPDDIIQFVREKSDHPMKMKELARALGVKRPEYAEFRQIVKGALASGELVLLKRNRIGLAEEMNIVVGQIAVTRSGTGFVTREGEQDLMIPPTHMGTALDGDRVMARLAGFRGEREAGVIVRVVERAERNIVGVFRKGRSFQSVTPDNPRFHRDIYIPAKATAGAKDGEKVVAVVTVWDDPHVSPEGEVTERLGFPGDPGVDMLTIVKSYGFPEAFPDDVLAEAERAAVMPKASELKDRLDITGETVYTIDPADAKDFDDAVSVTRLDRGYRLGVHIADVSFFVQTGTALNDEAFERGNSIYLPGMVIPMLPEILSNDICSLKPNRRRLAHSVFIDFDNKGKALRWELADTIIKSRSRLAYEEVQAFFDGKKNLPDRVTRVADNLSLARELARLVSGRRMAAGSLDFDLPEAKIILGDKGEVLELGNKVRLEAHRLVEEFMLAANRAVGLEVFRLAQPFLYRVHEKPDMEKMEAFSHMMTRLGLKFPVSPNLKPIHFSRFLEKIQDRPEADFINELMLRSMMKAVYQRENIGHFGLAFSHYTHFTSPIRRYSDLMVHRMLRQLKDGRYPTEYAKHLPSAIDHACRHCSETERTAERAEREAVKTKQAAYMADHVGEEHSGVITGVTSYGFYVRLDRLGVEGLVRMSSIDDDYYNHDEENYRIVGSRSGRSFRLGDSLTVGVLKVDPERHEIDLYLPERSPQSERGKNGKSEASPKAKRQPKSKAKAKKDSGAKAKKPGRRAPAPKPRKGRTRRKVKKR